MNQFLFQVCYAAASRLVRQYRATVPEGTEFYNGGGSISSTDTSFARNGTSSQSRTTDVANFLAPLINTTAQQSSVPSTLLNSNNSFLSNLLAKDPTKVQEQEYLDKALGSLDPGDFAGKSSLSSLAAIDPTSTSYEQGTQAKYEDMVKQALAQATTGPDSVRGGTARQSLREGEAAYRAGLERTEEIRKAREVDANLAAKSAEMLNNIEMGRRAALLQGQNQIMQQVTAQAGQQLQGSNQVDQKQAASANTQTMLGKLLSTDTQKMTENMSGKGSGNTSGMNVGANCCFIFIEAHNGMLPWFVRPARDMFYLEKPVRQDGYLRMSKWLVPAMRKSPRLKRFVQFVMTRPCIKYGAWLFNDPSAKERWKFYAPLVKTWFKVWELYGKA